jgi:branched-chain amino acid transport system ATP-binding protein
VIALADIEAARERIAESVIRTPLVPLYAEGAPAEQQMVAMARALMSHPRLLLMDEPSMGLSPALVQQNFEIIKTVHASGVSVLVVEQNATMALSVADRGYVLSTGEIVLQGAAAELLQHEDLKRAYLDQ